MDIAVHKAAIQMARDYVLDIEANTENMANASMPGYKRVDVHRSSFSAEVDRQVGTPGADNAKIVVSHTQGALRETGRPLDLAIEGDGFFVLSDGQREYYTRNGTFRVAGDGTIVNSQGMTLQGSGGALRIPNGMNESQFHLSDDRNIQIGGRVIGELKVVHAEPAQLLRAGNTLFTAEEPLTAEAEGSVLSGYVEQSNASIMNEMVSMMTTLRNYESCQKMIQIVDDIDRRMIGKMS